MSLLIFWLFFVVTCIVPLVVAILYAIAATVFVVMWREPWPTTTTTTGYTSLCISVSMLIVAIAVQTTVKHTTNILEQQQQQQQWMVMCAIVLFGAVSLYVASQSLRATRRTVVVGSRAPSTHISAATTLVLPPQEEDEEDDEMTIVITGANTGIGFETAQQLATLYQQQQQRVVNIVLCCRNLTKARQAQAAVEKSLGSKSAVKIHVQQLDLSTLASVRTAAAAIRAQFPVLHCLINNAGLMHARHVETVDKMDLTMQVNYTGHYLWTRLLQPALSSSSGRVIHVTSSTFALWNQASIPLDDLHCQNGRSYALFSQYALSKWCGLTFARECRERWPHIHTAAVHPGLVRTDVVRNMPWYLQWGNRITSGLLSTLQKTPTEGAWSSVYCAAFMSHNVHDSCGDDDLYWVNQKPIALTSSQKERIARDRKRLWAATAKEVGLEE